VGLLSSAQQLPTVTTSVAVLSSSRMASGQKPPRGTSLFSVCRSKTDFSLQSLASALYYLLHIICGHHTNTDDFFWWCVRLDIHASKAWMKLCFFSHSPSAFSSGVSVTYLPILASSCNCPDFSIPSRKHYLYEPPAHSPSWSFNAEKSHSCCSGLVLDVL
jgi:hypothetical protein